MAKYRKKPVIIEAIQWSGDNFQEIFDMQDNREVSKVEDANELEIKTLEGIHTAKLNDFIIKVPVFPDGYTITTSAFPVIPRG